MNRQDVWQKGRRIKRGIEWASPYGVYPGYTSNPVKGCQHECRWRMPTGDVAICYAEKIATGFGKKIGYDNFSDLRFEPRELDAIDKLKEPSGIFVDSMSDLVGSKVPDEWIQQVIDCMQRNPQHIFFTLTKNPPRLLHFQWPENAWIGVSAPPTFMFGNELSHEQQWAWYNRAFQVLADVDVPIRWTSIEPLSWDVSDILAAHFAHFEWAVIGAASNGAITYQPDEKVFRKAWQALGGKPCFLKGNIDKVLATKVCGHWLEEWPIVTSDWRETRYESIADEDTQHD